MRILVTGSTGFLGPYVVKELEKRCHDVIRLRRDEQGDLTDFSWTTNRLADADPHAIVHLAARCGGIGANMDKPGQFFYENMLMGMNVIHAAYAMRPAHPPKVLIAGTVCAYPKFTPVPFKEEDIWNGFPESSNAPYGVAKKSLLVMLQAYRQQYGLNGIYLIPVNLYGPGDHFDLRTSHVIPALIRKFHEAKVVGKDFVECWGTGSASREFLYVEDAAKGIVDGLEKYDGAEPVNLGSGKEIKIAPLAYTIRKIVGFEGEIKWDASKPDGQPRRCLDVSRARDRFGFEARMGFREGLERTYRWYLKEIA